MRKLYPAFLVLSQYGLMALMFFFSKGIPTGITLAFFILGLLIGLWAISHNKVGNFHIRPEFKTDAVLVKTGIYRFVRHPMYLSVALMMLMILIHTPSVVQWCMFAALIVTLFLKAHREEGLWLEKDPRYENYRKKTKCFVPFLL